MNNIIIHLRFFTHSLLLRQAIIVLVVVFGPVNFLCCQGNLTPTAPPGATFKTLQQVEPRNPISAALTITNPGSYYLTTNISVSSGNAITITTNDVTLDLNGFAVTAGAGGKGIAVPNVQRNISIRHGVVRNCPSDGISAGTVIGGLFSDLILANNGVWDL
ncbi:MAG: hypothetical protein M3Y82_06310 [Verrucomicrobiota bacterium]|nr:hypothetical protein [Verrucomicrobiota bacterium]